MEKHILCEFSLTSFKSIRPFICSASMFNASEIEHGIRLPSAT